MQAKLYIEDKLVELNDGVQFAINKQFEDIKNPTTIINEWTKTISIPFTSKNNTLFGNIFRPDRAVVTSTTPHPNSGIYFDPTKKASFRLMLGSILVMRGYAKLTQVKMNNGVGTYEVNLFGQLGDVLQNIKQITVNDLDVANYNRTFHIDRYFVKECWERDTPDMTKPLITRTYSEILGFACANQGLNDADFDSKSMEDGDGKTQTMSEILTQQYGEDSGVNIEGLIGDGLLPRQVGEYRSYYQTPYIYFPVFMTLMRLTISQKYGYGLVLDDEWFSTKNPYYNNLVMMLKRLQLGNTAEMKNSYRLSLYPLVLANGDNLVVDTVYKTAPVTTISEEIPMLSGNRFNTLPGKIASSSGVFYVIIRRAKISGEIFTRMDRNQAIKLHLRMKGQNGAERVYTLLFACAEFAGSTEGYDQVELIANASSAVGADDPDYWDGYDTWRVGINFNAPISADMFGDWVEVQYTYEFRFLDEKLWNSSLVSGNYAQTNLYISNVPTIMSATVSNLARSGASFKIADIWGDKTPFEVMIQYCKMFNILVIVDELTNTIKLTPRYAYFSEVDNVQDWGDHIDMNSEFTIQPLSFDTKYLVLDASSKTGKGEEYNAKYGVGFGGLRLEQPYEFNNSDTKLLDGVIAPLQNSANVLSWLNIQNKNFRYRNSESMPLFEKDGKPVDVFGAFYFHNGVVPFDTNIGSVMLSDDSYTQQATQKYAYYYSGYGTPTTYVNTYPALDIVRGDKMVTFGVPAEIFDATKSYDGLKGVYTNVWERYLTERYSIQTKLVTCYMWISPVEFAQFQFNKMVKINGVIYYINKIIDYDPCSTKPTKCELVSVTDRDAYTYPLLYDVIADTLVSYVFADKVTGSTMILAQYGTMNGSTLELPNKGN